jgi:predicted anti-sigma-YlaC factor YlaD
MRPHVGAKTLARYRQDDLTARRNARIGAHLAGCARCRARSEDLAGVTTLLASVHPPPVPQHLTARIQAALATEAAARAARPGEQAAAAAAPA